MSDITSYVGKRYIDDRNDLVDDNAPNSTQTDKKNEVRHSELPEGTRVIGPDDFVTMDYREDRLNLHVDSESVVTKAKMG